MASATVKVILRVIVQPDKVAAIRPVLLELATKSLQEKGCTGYQVLQNNADPCDFTLVEEWTSEGALDAHLQTAHVKDAFAKGGPLLAQPPDARRYSVID
jgi:quinol monooxygenase YgiN